MSKVLPVCIPVLLVGCSAIPLSSKPAIAQDRQLESAVPAGNQSAGMDSQLMFELMIAELAGRRGQLDVAMAGYLRASERTDDPRVSERATRLAIFGRQWFEAEKAAKRWIRLDPENDEAPQILGQALLRQDKTSEVSAHYIQLVSASDDRSRSLRDIQFELQRNDNRQQSLQVVQNLLVQFPDEIEAHLGVARGQLGINDRQAALSAVNEGLSKVPADTDALLLKTQILSAIGRPDEGFSVLSAALDKAPDNTRLRLGYAQLLVESGRYDSVGEQLDTLFSDDGQNPDTLLTISLLALDSRRLERAQTYLEALIATDEYQDQANFYLARISDEQQDYLKAIAFYDAVEDGELQLNARIRAAELTALTGNLEQGRSRLRQLAASVRNPAVQPRLITTESRMLRNADKAEDALLVLSDGLKQFPESSDLLYARALAADGVGDSPMMVKDLTRLIELEPDNAHALNALGYHYADNNIELEQAEKLLVKANKLLPEDPAIMDSLGWLRYRQGDFSAAIELLRGAYQLFPDPEIAAHLGEALWLSGEQNEAKELIEAALVDNPEDARLLKVKKKYIE